MSSAVCWKWIFSVERKRTGSVRARGSAQGDDPRSPQGQALTIRGCVDLDANKACLWYLIEVSLALTSSTIIFGRVFCPTEVPTF